jgi:hypothetical protein
MSTNDNEREVTSASQPGPDGEQVDTEIVGGQGDNPQQDPKVVAAIEEAAASGDLDEGGIAPLSVQEAEVEHASEAYNLEVPGAGVVDATVEADLEARKSLAAEPHREVENDELQSLAIGEDASYVPAAPVFINSIRPDEKVQVVVRERTADDPNDFGIESTEQERIVKDLAESGQLFDKGGPLVNWTGDTADLSDGVDGLFLAERSKQTGSKLF